MSKAEELQKELLYNREHGSENLNGKETFAFSEDYKGFLNACKTERECVEFTLEQAEKAGFKPLSAFDTLKKGDKIELVEASSK